jgi:hypothetical protein
MGHLILLHMIVIVGLGWWCTVNYSPPILSLIMPRRFVFALGAAFFTVGVFLAFVAASEARDPQLFMGGLIECFIGGWLMLAPAAAMRGTAEFSRAMNALAVLLIGLVGVMYIMFYVQTPAGFALLNLWLLLFGVLLTTIWRRVCR